MSDFDEKWEWLANRAGGPNNPVQEKSELRHIYNLMLGCKSYLEIGSAEGSTLYVLGSALDNFKYQIEYVDLCEAHTEELRREAIQKLGKKVFEIKGDSTHKSTYDQVKQNRYDCVLIDGGHDFATVLSDCILYAPLAKRYVFFHDVQLPAVKAAVEMFNKNWNLGEYTTYVNSNNYGYGVLRCLQQQ